MNNKNLTKKLKTKNEIYKRLYNIYNIYIIQ